MKLMRTTFIVLVIAAASLSGCNKSTTSTTSAKTSDAKTSDAFQGKLEEVAGGNATDCGRLKSQAEEAMKSASKCVMDASQGKRPFYVAYEMPGMTIGVAGNSEGKLFSVQSQQQDNAQPGTMSEPKSVPCPAELRVAQSGRVTCFAPVAMGAPGGSPHGGMPPSGTANPHAGGMMAPRAITPQPGNAPPKRN
jgi:hypothetical protein